jgi:hypothetical protein
MEKDICGADDWGGKKNPAPIIVNSRAVWEGQNSLLRSFWYRWVEIRIPLMQASGSNHAGFLTSSALNRYTFLSPLSLQLLYILEFSLIL